MSAHHAPTPRGRMAGFTLVELMVGLALGLLTVAIIAQVVVLSEGQKRTATNGSDAQISGALSLYAVQHDVQMAGYGLTSNPLALGCTVKYKVGTVAGNFPLVPVSIATGVNGSDIITTLRSVKTTFATPIKVISDHLQAATYFTVASTVGVSNGDLMIAAPDAYNSTDKWCTVFQVNDDPATKSMTSSIVPHAAATAAPWNPATPADIMPTAGYAGNASYLLNLGNMVMTQFSVNDTTHTLQSSSMTKVGPTWSTAVDVQPQVVVMKALYGKDNTHDGVVDLYNKTAPTTNDEWQQIKSIRVLIVTRSSQLEKADELVTPNALTWDVGSSAVPVDGATPCASNSNSQCLTISLTFLGTDWQRYRYKVYDTIIPLRNVLWNK
jgi:type IV pilus assembly protein PilW